MMLSVTKEMRPGYRCLIAHGADRPFNGLAESSTLDVAREAAALRQMTVNDLREKYAEVFGEETKVRHKEWLARRIIWRMQAIAEGDLSERARRRAAELANDADLRTTAPRAIRKSTGLTATATLPLGTDRRLPVPGQTLTRVYKGETYVVHVRPDNFEFDGEIYRSLSAVANKITGTHCNGYLFFRLNGKGGRK